MKNGVFWVVTPCGSCKNPEDTILQLYICSYPEPDQISLHHTILSLQNPSQYYPPNYTLVFLVVSFSLTLLPTCHVHFIHLDLTILIKLGEEYKSRNSSLCSFLQPPVTLSLFGQNNPLSTLFSFLNIETKFHSHKEPQTKTKKIQTQWLFVCKTTVPTERPPLVGEFYCKLLRIEGCCVVSAAEPPRPLMSVF
jgi:hypothetical protein